MKKMDHIKQILGLVCSVFDAYSAVLFLRQRQTADYALASCFSLGDSIDLNCVVQSGHGIVGSMLVSNQPLLISNFERKSSRLEYYDLNNDPNVKAFMGCVLPNQSGILCLDSKRTFAFTEKDQKILHLFADLIYSRHKGYVQAAEAMADSRYYHCLQLIQNLRRRMTKWDGFLENLLMILSEATGFEYCFLSIMDERGAQYYLEGVNRPFFRGNADIRFAAGNGLLGWVYNNNQAIFLDNRESGSPSPLFGKNFKTPDFKSIICLPLNYQKSTTGVLGFAHEQGMCIDDSLKSFSEMAAAYLELFLENLFLKSRVVTLERVQPKN